MRIRHEHPSDAAAIDAVIVAAFRNAKHGARTESCIVRALRDAGRLSVSLVAQDGDALIGHVAASPVSVSDGTPAWYGLGPLSVTPDRQGHGVGAQRMAHALMELRARGAAGCVVLGEPGFYARFGFDAVPSLRLPGVPAEYFQAVRFEGAWPSGVVAYHAAFAA